MAMSFYHKEPGKPERLVRKIAAETEESYCVALDPAMLQDYSAFSVMHYTRTPLESWTPKEGKFQTVIRQDCIERAHVVHLERHIGVEYPDIARIAADIMAREPVRRFNADLVIDVTGVGMPVAQSIAKISMLRPVMVTITGGTEETQVDQRHFHVPKVVLISGLDAALHNSTLQVAPLLTEAGAFKDELGDFRRHITATGRNTWEARSGKHDDLILAVALSLWWLRHKQRRKPSTGLVRGLLD